MKLVVGILIFLSAFILGYSLADYTKLPSRLYVIEGKNVDIQWRRGGKEGTLTLRELPDFFLYFSKEKPKHTLKKISREEFIKNWQEMKAISQESFFVSIEAPSLSPQYHHAFVQDLFYKAEEGTLMVKIMLPDSLEEEKSKQEKPSSVPMGATTHFDSIALRLFQVP